MTNKKLGRRRRIAATILAFAQSTLAPLDCLVKKTDRKKAFAQADKIDRWLLEAHASEGIQRLKAKSLAKYRASFKEIGEKLLLPDIQVWEAVFVAWWHVDYFILHFEPEKKRAWLNVRTTLETLCKILTGRTIEELHETRADEMAMDVWPAIWGSK